MFYQAMQIGVLESAGIGWRRRDEYVNRIRALTPAQIQAAARRYLNDDALTVTWLKPLSTETMPP